MNIFNIVRFDVRIIKSTDITTISLLRHYNIIIPIKITFILINYDLLYDIDLFIFMKFKYFDIVSVPINTKHTL
jgi:hypothetical protein